MAKSTTENPAESGGGRDEAETLVAPAPKLDASGRTPVWVQYVGGADVREIDAASWKNVDVNDQGKVVWDKRKFRGDRVPVEQLSAGALEYCVQFDSGFVLLDADGKKI